MMRFFRIWFLVIVVYLFGVLSVMFSIQPMPAILDLYLYVTDNRWETKSVTERIKSDIDLVPYRVLTRDAGGAPDDPRFHEIALPGTNPRRAAPSVFIDPGRTPRLTLIHGVFDFADGLHGAVLLDEAGEVRHTWALTERQDYPNRQTGGHLYPHGVLIDPDGALTYIFDFGGTITKIDWCGRLIWSRGGHDYNHVLERGDDGSIWTIDGQIAAFLKIDPSNGEVIERIAFGDVLKANANRGIFTTRYDHFETGPRALGDPFHANDIEPLPAALAPMFPMFRAGDLLISLRALNLVFVLDPATYRVKWYSQGETQLQHDPDWQADGTIIVLDNHWFQPPSRLIALDPKGGPPRIVLKGADYDFFTPNRGKFARLENGGYLVTSTKQGRVFETDATGKVVFEFINTFDNAEGLRALVSEAIPLAPDFFGDLPNCD